MSGSLPPFLRNRHSSLHLLDNQWLLLCVGLFPTTRSDVVALPEVPVSVAVVFLLPGFTFC